MTIAQLPKYVRVDEYDMLRVGDTRVSLDSVVCAFDEGDTAETIVRNFPALSLEQVYGAIAYYLGNRDEVRAYLQRNRAEFERLRTENIKATGPLRERLLAFQRQRGQSGSTT